MIQVSLDLNSLFTHPRSCFPAGYRVIIRRKRYGVAIWRKGNFFGAPHLDVKGMPPGSRDYVPRRTLPLSRARARVRASGAQVHPLISSLLITYLQAPEPASQSRTVRSSGTDARIWLLGAKETVSM